MEGALLLDVIIRESAAIFELLSGEDEASLVGRSEERRVGKECW